MPGSPIPLWPPANAKEKRPRGELEKRSPGMAFLFVSYFKGFKSDRKVDAEGKALLSSFDLQDQRNLQAPGRRDSGLAAGNNPDILIPMGHIFLPGRGGGLSPPPFPV